jgi:riboflavin synthase
MFTGIIEEIGAIRRLQRRAGGYEMTVQANSILEGTQLGHSIAVNGVCLTVTHITRDAFTVGLSTETRARTNLVHYHQGDPVNLERSLTPSSRMGGHFVQGHVDGVGMLSGLRADEDSLWLTLTAPDELMRYIVPKGFIALDGASLTVVDVSQNQFTVMLVAYSRQHLTLGRQKAGYRVNIEVDVLGKYVEAALRHRLATEKALSLDFLAEHGYV